MTQRLHSYDPSVRLAGTQMFGKGVIASCGNCLQKGNEWFDATGTRREVGLRQM